MMPIRILPLCLLALVTPLAAQEARDTTLLPPIVVTATRSPLPASALGSGVTVLDGAALRRAGIATVAEALRGAPSVALAQSGSWGAQTSLFLRGGENDYVRVLVDGVVLNQAGGFLDLAGLGTDNVERIEIVRGPASVLYGSDAVSGVVQVITRGGRGPARISAAARAGSFAIMEVAASAAAGGRRLALSGGVERQATDGTLAFNNAFAHSAASLRGSWRPDAATDVGLTVRARSGRYRYPTDGAGNAVDSNQLQDTRQSTVALEVGRRLGDGLEARLLLGADVRRDSLDDAPDFQGDTLGLYEYRSRTDYRRTAADLRTSVAVRSWATATLGAALEEQRERSAGRYASEFGPGTSSTDLARVNRAFYAQVVTDGGRLGLQAGVRVDDNQRFGRFVTWRTAASLRLAAATRMRVNAGTAFKEPTFVENDAQGYAVGNPDLAPERSVSVEAGLEQAVLRGRLTLAATVFAQRFRDMVQYTFATAAPTDPNFYNVASAEASGLEVEVRAAPVAAVRIVAQLTALHTSAADSGFDGTVFAPGRRLLRRPTHSGSASVEWLGSRGVLGIRVAAVGSRDDLDFGTFPTPRVVLPAYGRLDLWGEVPLLRTDARSGIALTVRVDNVTAARYAEVHGFPAPGRRVLVGLRAEGGP